MFTSLSLTQEWISLSTSFSPLSHLFESTSNFSFFECARRRTTKMFGDFSESLQECHYLWRQISLICHSSIIFLDTFLKKSNIVAVCHVSVDDTIIPNTLKIFSTKELFFWGWKFYFLNQQASDEMMTVTLSCLRRQ